MADDQDISPTNEETAHLKKRRKEGLEKQRKKRRERLYGNPNPNTRAQENVDAFHGLFIKPPRALARNVASADGTVNDRVCTRVGNAFVAGAGVASYSKKLITRNPKKREGAKSPFQSSGDGRSEAKSSKPTPDNGRSKDGSTSRETGNKGRSR